MITPKIMAGIVSLGSISVASTTGVYMKNYETIWDKLGNDVIPNKTDNGLNTAWQTLKIKLKDKKDLKNRRFKNINLDSSDNPLQKWCSESYRIPYRTLFQKKNEELLKDVKSACVLTIKDHMSSNTLEVDNDSSKENFKKNLEILNKYSDNDLNLEESLKNLQKTERSNSDPDKNWNTLREICKTIYERGFQGENTNSWKLANKFCKKQEVTPNR